MIQQIVIIINVNTYICTKYYACNIWQKTSRNKQLKRRNSNGENLIGDRKQKQKQKQSQVDKTSGWILTTVLTLPFESWHWKPFNVWL